jgi:Flp pilus assembly protein CpaB
MRHLVVVAEEDFEVATDISEDTIREVALPMGLVDIERSAPSTTPGRD